MIALLLAGGYGTRLYPVTLNISKPLLPINGRPMIEFVLDRLDEIDEIEHAYVITNQKFAASYNDWKASSTQTHFPVEIINDGTSGNEDRLGAIGDMEFGLKKAKIDDDVFIIGCDNLFDFSLVPFAEFFRENDRSAVACFDVGSLELVKKYSEIRLDGVEVVGFVEKPIEPQTSLVGICAYIYKRSDLPHITRYLSEGNSPDKSGDLVAWMAKERGMVGHILSGQWLDIGTNDEYDRAQKLWKSKA